MAIEFGELIFNAAISNITIGNMSIREAALYQGNNTFPFTGTIDINTVFDNCKYVLLISTASYLGSLKPQDWIRRKFRVRSPPEYRGNRFLHM